MHVHVQLPSSESIFVSSEKGSVKKNRRLETHNAPADMQFFGKFAGTC
jgi:hypothetical protein